MTRPNILLLHSHNTGRFVQPHGYAVPTPHLQQLAGEGVMFRQAFTVSPTCSPSRACLMTGQYPHVNGMLGLAHRGFRLHDYDRTLIRVLRRAGYTTVLAGVQHIARDPAALGYELRLNPDSTRAADVVPGVVRFLDERPRGPFFLDVGFNETHRPFVPPGPADDARYVRPPPALPDHPSTRADTAAFRASARAMDRGFGEVLKALDERGLRDDTWVLCLSDHGLQFPHHMCHLTDRGLGTFFIARGPGGFTGGRVIDAMVTHMDVFPTICELAGIAVPEWVQGRSFAGLARGTVARLHEEIHGEVTHHAAYEPQRGVRTERWKYIRRFDARERPVLPNTDRGPSRDLLVEHGLRDQPRWQEALFDLLFDPHEVNNLAGDARAAPVRDDLRARLARWMRETRDPLLDGPVPVPAGGQYTPVDNLHPMDGVVSVP